MFNIYILEVKSSNLLLVSALIDYPSSTLQVLESKYAWTLLSFYQPRCVVNAQNSWTFRGEKLLVIPNWSRRCVF